MTVDEIDRKLLELLQQDATQPYAALGTAVGLSAGTATSEFVSSGPPG